MVAFAMEHGGHHLEDSASDQTTFPEALEAANSLAGDSLLCSLLSQASEVHEVPLLRSSPPPPLAPLSQSKLFGKGGPCHNVLDTGQ